MITTKTELTSRPCPFCLRETLGSLEAWVQDGTVFCTQEHAKLYANQFLAENPKSDKYHTFESGAKRSELKPRFDLIPSCALRRLAKRYEYGAVVRGYGEDNWKKGLPFGDTLNHVIDHLLKYRDKVEAVKAQHPEDWRKQLHLCAGIPDDDLAAAMWGVAALTWLEENEAFL